MAEGFNKLGELGHIFNNVFKGRDVNDEDGFETVINVSVFGKIKLLCLKLE